VDVDPTAAGAHVAGGFVNLVTDGLIEVEDWFCGHILSYSIIRMFTG